MDCSLVLMVSRLLILASIGCCRAAAQEDAAEGGHETHEVYAAVFPWFVQAIGIVVYFLLVIGVQRRRLWLPGVVIWAIFEVLGGLVIYSSYQVKVST